MESYPSALVGMKVGDKVNERRKEVAAPPPKTSLF